MNETEFTLAADRAFETIGKALDLALETSDEDVDWSVNDGVLEIECGDGSKLIVNRHAANREIWIAARSGGFHFRPQGGQWVDTRSGEALPDVLTRLLAEQARIRVDLSLLRG